MPISSDRISHEFPNFDRLDLFREMQRRIPWAKDASYSFDEYPCLSVPGAIIWVRPKAHDHIDEYHEEAPIIIEFFTPGEDIKVGYLMTASIDLAHIVIFAHLLLRSLNGQLEK